MGANYKKHFTELKDNWGGVDKKILNLVIVLNELGFETIGSCEGHLRDGAPSPYVAIRAFSTNTKVGSKRNTKAIVMTRIEELLKSFYSTRDNKILNKITVTPGPFANGIRLSCGEKYTQRFMRRLRNQMDITKIFDKNENEMVNVLPDLQKEMIDFAKFLKSVKN